MNFRILIACIVAICIPQFAYSGEDVDLVPPDSIDNLISEMKVELEALPPATNELSFQIDGVIENVISMMEFASNALKKGDLSIVIDSLGLAKGSFNVAITKLPNVTVMPNEKLISSLEGKGLTEIDVKNVKALMVNMAEIEMAALPELSGLIDRIENSGMDLANLNEALDSIGSSTEEVVKQIQVETSFLMNFAQSLQSILENSPNIDNYSREIGAAIANLGGTLQQAAEAVASTIAAGVNVSLESAAQGAGFSSFASAVDAYNEEYGTNYTVESAKEALGQ
jgi:hypothetical protein